MEHATQGMSVLGAVYHWEQTIPERPYLTQPTGGGQLRRYTWAETLDQARRMAAHLRARRLPAGSQIALLTKNCAHFFLAELAAWMAGHATVAIYPTYDARSLRHVLQHSDASLLFVGKLDTWDELRQGLPPELPCVALPLAPPTELEGWDAIVAGTEPLTGNPERGAEELATILYTSGSTGQPKGVMHSFGGIAATMHGLMDHYADFYEDSTTERVLSYLPLAHSFERLCLQFPSYFAGCQVFFAESIETFLEDLKRARPTMFISVPRLWIKFQLGVFQELPPRKLERLLKVPLLSRLVKKRVLSELGLDAVRIATSGSAPLPADVLTWYRKLGLELNEGYGMTEDFAYSHISLPGQGRVGYVGSPLPGVQVRFSDEGEVLIRSPGAMMGYYKEPELTAESRTEDGFFRTGDLGEQDEEGRLKITGRVKELFKTSRGKYVAPAPIENLLNASPNVEQSCVLGAGMAQPAALVLPAEELAGRADDPAGRQAVTEELAGLLEQVNGALPHHEQLAHLIVVKDPWLVENGYLTPTLKIRRGAIEDGYASRLQAWYGSGEPVIWEA